MPGTGVMSQVEIVVRGHAASDSKKLVNVFHYDTGAGIPASYYPALWTKAEVLTAFKTSTAALWPLLSVDYVQDSYSIRNVADPTDPETIDTTGLVNGAVTGDVLPSDQAIVSQYKTGLRGRNFKGSKHYGTIAESATTANEIEPATAYGLWLAGVALPLAPLTVTHVVAVSWLLCIYSKSQSNYTSLPYYSLTMTPVTSVVLNRTIGIMKRRKERTVV